MGKLFGTDGIRGRANMYPMTAETALKTGRAVAAMFDKNRNMKIVIGKDTRISGAVFEHALIAGICSMGTDVYMADVIPTPGVAHLTAAMEDAAAGIVISASHNPFHDNGIKIFKGNGFKLSDSEEEHLEKLILDENLMATAEGILETGKVFSLNNAGQIYVDFLKASLSADISDFKGLKAVIDCSNGAASNIAPALFNDLGLDATFVATTPDGKNINKNCGSEHTEVLIKKVLETGADLGLAFDGDADRLIAVDEKGCVVSGDQVIAVCAKHEMEKGRLENNCVVTTVMSNMGLGAAFQELGITHRMARVGDRNVLHDMLECGAVVGGEDSGHMIFLRHHTTGDGIISALKLLQVIKTTGKPLSELKTVMTVYPQRLVNVEVKSKPEINSVPEIKAAVAKAEKALKGEGRVLVRYSGTQPMCRVMVEGPTPDQTEAQCGIIADIIRDVIGA